MTQVGDINSSEKGITPPMDLLDAKNYFSKYKAIDSRTDAIGDVNSTEKGSGARYNAGKVDLSLIPLVTLEDEARVWMHGAKKYAKNNWMKGMDWNIPLACALRHLAAFQRGEDTDPESGLPHIAHAMCNLRMLTLYSKNYPEGDTRPKEWLEDFNNVDKGQAHVGNKSSSEKSWYDARRDSVWGPGVP